MKYLWFIAAALFCVAAISVFFAFQQPEFVLGLAVAAMGSLFTALTPSLKKLFKRKSHEEEVLDRAYYRMGRTRPTKRNPHPKN